MKYRLDFGPKLDVSSPSITGALVQPVAAAHFVAWQPSSWPPVPTAVDEKFVFTLKRIFEESILGEIENVMADVVKAHGDLEHRGHVIAIALMCALTAISSSGYRGPHAAKFIRRHFRADFRPHADDIYVLYRNGFMHDWNLLKASIFPDDTRVKREGGVLSFGLLDFSRVLVDATQDFLESLESDAALQRNALKRYKDLQEAATP
jgi:hypothetical protein